MVPRWCHLNDSPLIGFLFDVKGSDKGRIAELVSIQYGFDLDYDRTIMLMGWV
jgi:hypothetical protein